MAADSSFSDLLRRVRTGDSQSAAELLRIYEPEVRRLIRLSLTDPKLRRVYDSADIFQSVFANFYVRLVGGQFELDEPRQLVRLLATMARNKIVDYARKACNKAATASPDLLAEVVGHEPSASSILLHEEMLSKVQGLLTAEERRLADQWADGKSWSELAAEFDSTPDALRKRLERALDRVCRQLDTAEVDRG